MKTIRSINSGGYGEVFEVEMPDGSRVALKKFRPQSSLNASEIDKARKRFVREVGMQQRLAKYGTLPILESGLTDDPPWFTMPLADRNYREQITLDRAAGTITPEPLADILNCLEEVHQRGFVHRDLKPENILRVDGRWYLSDLGLAIDIDHMATQKLTTTGSAYGTPMYMAPEQVRDFSRVSPAADIFSFGCILHDLVDGGVRGFFTTATTKGQWDSLIRRCTAIDPAKRFASIKALRSVLLQTVRKHSDLKQTPATIAWAAELANIEGWDPEKIMELVRVLEEEDPGTESGVLAELTSEHLVAIKLKCLDGWLSIGRIYAQWMNASFTFSFCDVIADRAVMFFDSSENDVELKALVLMGLARLGYLNHRYYVMKQFVRRCGKDLDTYVAERLQFELQAEEDEFVLAACVRELFGYSQQSYHPCFVS